MNARRVIFVCNALDDSTRLARGITTDSPAASRKVLQLCLALRLAGAQPSVLSLGRGRAGASTTYFGSQVRRVQGIPFIYAPFSKLRGLSELLSLLAPAGLAWKLRRCPPPTVIFYNRDVAYVPTLLVTAWLGFRRVLDLEDGEVHHRNSGMGGWISGKFRSLFDALCTSGALLACSALANATSARPTLCYYGTAVSSYSATRWRNADVQALLGGTLAPETGVDILIGAIRTLRRTQPRWASRLHLQITGKGPSMQALQTLAEEPHSPRITVHGRTSDEAYRAIVDGCEIGLALKPCRGVLADTTFPSKVVEMASAGLLVLTTDISDVRTVLQNGALYLQNDEPEELIELLRRAVENRSEAQAMAAAGAQAVWQLCAPAMAGSAVADFLFDEAR
jgi:glycosyltransferase involved in cell wall biosynthesis